jgi:hypothetical protein
MVQLRHLNYLIIAFFTSGISLSCSNHVNMKKIETMNIELERLRDENESLRKEVKPNPTLKSIVSELDDCLTILMREIMDNPMDGVDSDLRNEINAICHKIIETVPKPLKLEVEEEEEEQIVLEEDTIPLEREKNDTSDSLSSSESYDNISILGVDA